MPPGLHGELARAAEREGTSLNGYIIARLAEAVGRPSDVAAAPVAAGAARATSTLTWLLVANVAAVALAGIAALVIVLVASFD